MFHQGASPASISFIDLLDFPLKMMHWEAKKRDPWNVRLSEERSWKKTKGISFRVKWIDLKQRGIEIEKWSYYAKLVCPASHLLSHNRQARPNSIPDKLHTIYYIHIVLYIWPPSSDMNLLGRVGTEALKHFIVTDLDDSGLWNIMVACETKYPRSIKAYLLNRDTWFRFTEQTIRESL